MWSDKYEDRNPGRGKGMRISWGSLLVGVAIGYVACAYGPKFLNR